MKLYLAHPLEDRHEILEWQKTMKNVEFVNPFYDIHRDDIHEMDKRGVLTEEGRERTLEYCCEIVDRDLEAIRKCDGVLAFVNKSIGTSMEMIMAFRVYWMPVFVVSEKYHNHSWVRANSTKQFGSKEEFERWINALHRE